MSEIIKIARTTLLMLNEKGLAPTPDNYAKIYCEVSGEEYTPFVRESSSTVEPSLPKSTTSLSTQEIIENNRKIVSYLDDITSSVTANTSDLAEKLKKQNDEFKAFVAELKSAGNKLHIVELMEPIMVLLDAVLLAITNAYSELVTTREDLHEVSEELNLANIQSLNDKLTGARNRLYLDANISKEIARARRNKTKLTLVMVDLDHFKQLNETYGSNVGDKVLERFAKVAMSTMREIDTFFRYGDGEFVFSLPQATRDGASSMIERFREGLSKSYVIEPKKNSPLIVTFSGGVSELTEKDDVESILSRAQKTLKIAKERGMNRVVNDWDFEELVVTKNESEKNAVPVKNHENKHEPTIKANKISLSVESFFLGRRPILHLSQQIAGYDLSLHAYGHKSYDSGLGDMAKVLADIGSAGVLQDHFGLVTISLDELMDNQAALLPSGHIVLELSDAELDETQIAKIMELKTRGFKFAIKDYFKQPINDVVLKLLDFVKLDIEKTSQVEMTEALKRISKLERASPIATNVSVLQQFERSRELQIGLVEGFFFIHPDSSSAGKTNPDQTMLLIVMGQLLTDVELPRIEKAFQGHTALITNLLTMVNSAGMGLSRTVDSLQQALVILGRRHLMRWVQVLLYSNSDIKGAKMLMQMAATRAKLMDLLCATHKEAEKRQELYKDSAFTVGILSLTDVLLGMDLAEILDQIGLDVEIKQALLEREGFLGALLLLTEKVEKAEFSDVELLLKKLGIEAKDLRRAQKETLRWVNDLGKSSDD